MNRIKEIERINMVELEANVSESASWHAEYKHSAYVIVSGLDYRLSEGDVITVFSQCGEIVDCNLMRDKLTGKSRGFAFLAFEDQRSTVLAVDNFNGAKLLKRLLRVDHVKQYRRPKTSVEAGQEGVNETDEDYDERRKRIWDYELYESVKQPFNDGNIHRAGKNSAENNAVSGVNVDESSMEKAQIDRIEAVKRKRKVRRAEKDDKERRQERQGNYVKR